MSDTKTDKIRKHYDTVADTYDSHYDHHRGKKYHTHLSSHLMKALPEGGNLLDIGCGTGLFVEKYIKNGGCGFQLCQEPSCHALGGAPYSRAGRFCCALYARKETDHERNSFALQDWRKDQDQACGNEGLR